MLDLTADRIRRHTTIADDLAPNAVLECYAIHVGGLA